MSNMSNDWNLISVKINSLLKSSAFLYNTFQVNKTDHYNVVKDIAVNANKTFNIVEKFKNEFEISLSANSLKILNDFIESNKNMISKLEDKSINPELKKGMTISIIVNLSLIENEMTYHLKDSQEFIVRSVDIAFNHLQRQLIADESIREVWIKAKNELDFEKLGGAHLLLHKIWGFKIYGAGERTDLVLANKIDIENDPLYRSVDGLVLTEWKVVRKENEKDNCIDQAIKQCKAYSKGSLSAIELSKYRYVVLVSENYLNLEKKFTTTTDDIIYKIINIAYNPKPPSKR